MISYSVAKSLEDVFSRIFLILGSVVDCGAIVNSTDFIAIRKIIYPS